MTDYIKQVAEAVLDAALCSQDIDLGTIIASVPKPDPFGYFCQWENTQHLYIGEPGNASEDDWMSIPTTHKNLPLYSYPLDAQEEIDRLKAEASKREGFIDQLLSEKSGSDIANNILNCSLEHLRTTRHGELIKAASLGSYGASPNDVARLIEQERENAD